MFENIEDGEEPIYLETPAFGDHERVRVDVFDRGELIRRAVHVLSEIGDGDSNLRTYGSTDYYNYDNNNGCVPFYQPGSDWFPDGSAVCEGVGFAQTRIMIDAAGCGAPYNESRISSGTLPPDWQTGQWNPHPDDFCSDETRTVTRVIYDRNGCKESYEESDVMNGNITPTFGPWTSWTPAESTVCYDKTVYQTRSRNPTNQCGETEYQQRTVQGTMTPIWGAWTPWSPDTSTVCDGESFKQFRYRVPINDCSGMQSESQTVLGTNTDPAQCSGNTGACCMTSGGTGENDCWQDACETLTRQECLNKGGNWKGAGTRCNGGIDGVVGECGDGKLACCKDGDCQYLTQCDCAKIGGTYSNSNISCDELEQGDNADCKGVKKYWRVTAVSHQKIGNPTCTTTFSYDYSSDCVFGTPAEVARASVTGNFTTKCPQGDYCADRVKGGDFSKAALDSQSETGDVSPTAQAIFKYEDCDLNNFDYEVTVSMVACDPPQ